MADHNNAAAPALNTPIESHRFDEKKGPIEGDVAPPRAKVEEDEEEDEDMDALIEDLESQDGHQEEEEEGSCCSVFVPRYLRVTTTHHFGCSTIWLQAFVFPQRLPWLDIFG